MTEPLGVDTDNLGKAGSSFRDLATTLRGISDSLQEGVRAQGACWGSDSSGEAFAAQYAPARNKLLLGLRDTADVVASTADGVETMSRGFARTEQGAVDAAQEIGSRVQGVDVPTTSGPSPAGPRPH